MSVIQKPNRILARSAGPKIRNAAVLVLVLGLAAACTGQTVRHDPPAVGQYAVAIRVDPQTVQAGQKATINYAFTNQQTHKPELTLPLVYGATVHTTLVNHDLSWFRTGQATGPVNGVYPVNLIFNGPDSYRMYAEFTSGYTPTERLLYTHTLSFGLGVPSLDQPAPLVASADLQNAFFGVVVKLDTGGPLKVGRLATFHYTLTQVGTSQPVQDAAPFDDAAGHLFVISADGAEFAHLVAREAITGAGNAENEPTAGGSSGSGSGNPVAPGQPGATPSGGATPEATATAAGLAGPTSAAPSIGPNLTFAHTFAKPGLYKTWLQFLYHGNMVTADYVVNVTQ